jgi:hypothetical protein
MKGNKPLNVYIVAGVKGSWKTTLIYDLANKTNKNRGCWFTEIIDKNGSKMDFYFKTKSLQEEGMSPREFRNKINSKKKKFQSILIALRTDYTTKNKRADDYIDYFVNTCKWNVAFVAELNNGKFLQHKSSQYKYKYRSFPQQSNKNQLVNLVKNFFNFK